MTDKFKQLMGKDKPIIGMSHFLALPGDPSFKKGDCLDHVADEMIKDVIALQEGGIDAILFSNEHSRPWRLQNQNVTQAAMSYVLGRVKAELNAPFGVHVIWDAKSTIDLGAATNADFIWEVFTGAYGSDYGLWDTDPGKWLRHKRALSSKAGILAEIIPEAAAGVAKRNIAEVAKTTAFNFPADVLCIAGIKPGVPPDRDLIKQVKDENAHVKVFATTGMKTDNIEQYFSVADGFVVGSALKKDGNLFNPVDGNRVKEFVKYVNSLRK